MGCSALYGESNSVGLQYDRMNSSVTTFLSLTRFVFSLFFGFFTGKHFLVNHNDDSSSVLEGNFGRRKTVPLRHWSWSPEPSQSRRSIQVELSIRSKLQFVMGVFGLTRLLQENDWMPQQSGCSLPALGRQSKCPRRRIALLAFLLDRRSPLTAMDLLIFTCTTLRILGIFVKWLDLLSATTRQQQQQRPIIWLVFHLSMAMDRDASHQSSSSEPYVGSFGPSDPWICQRVARQSLQKIVV